jgi:hypothetical protein
MSCAPEEQRVSITNQDSYPLTVVVTGEGEDQDNKGEIIETYEVAAGRLDEETGVYIPTTTKLCIGNQSKASLVIRYTQGSKCVHRVFPSSEWMSSAESPIGFAYTVPAWNAGDPGEVCRVANTNSNKNSRNNDAPVDDDDLPPGNSNEHWWRWFWPRQGRKRVNTTHMATMTAVAFLVLAALVYYMFSKRM